MEGNRVFSCDGYMLIFLNSGRGGGLQFTLFRWVWYTGMLSITMPTHYIQMKFRDCSAKILGKSGLCGGPRTKIYGEVGGGVQSPSMGGGGFLLEQP